eukprot:g46330.t1
MVQTKFGQIADFRFSDDEGNTSKEAIARTLASRYDRTGERRPLLFSDKAGNTEWCKDFTTDQRSDVHHFMTHYQAACSQKSSLAYFYFLQALAKAFLPPADNNSLITLRMDDCNTIWRPVNDSFPTPESLFHRDNVTLHALPDPPKAQGKVKNFSWTGQKLFDLTTAYYEQKNTNNKKQSVNWNIFAHYYSMGSRYCWHKADIKDVFKRDKESLKQRCKDNSKKRKRP